MTEKRIIEQKFLLCSHRGTALTGLKMGMPLAWHRRHALLIASQLPDNQDDALLVVEAVKELLETFMAKGPAEEPARASNVLPFATG